MDYKNGKIYTIRSYQTDKFYIGSTCSTLTKRLYQHKTKYKYGTLTSTSREIVKYNDCYIELLEAFECKNKNELRQREGELIRKYKNDIVNCRIENRTKDEWRGDNKNDIKIKAKQYYEKNKDTIIKYHKKYQLENKNKILEYRQKNTNVKFVCECGGKYTKTNLSKHIKTKKHQKYLDRIKVV